jgi:transposase
MSWRRMSKEELVTLKVLVNKGQPNTKIAKVLGVSEGTVRYHRRKMQSRQQSPGCGKPFRAEAMARVIAHWIKAHKDQKRPINVKELFEHLVHTYGYEGSYRSVLRFVRAHYPKPKIRTWRRVETVAGAQSQTDWGEYPRVVVSGEHNWLHAFVMTLSHSRMPAVVWAQSSDQLSWHACHNKAFIRLGGIPAVNRIDNLKTGIATGAGAWGVINQSYRAYAREVRFHIDACPPRAGNAKGKVEAKVKLSRTVVNPYRRQWDTLDELQHYSDKRIERWANKSICPATGLSVFDSWQREKPLLQPLPILPEPFDVAVTRTVRPDCMVYFEDRYYPVPFAYVKEQVEVRGCSGSVQILAHGRIVRQYPRHTPERILIDPTCYQGEATDRVMAPVPLGKMGKKLEEIYHLPVQARPIDLYAALAEVAR